MRLERNEISMLGEFFKTNLDIEFSIFKGTPLYLDENLDKMRKNVKRTFHYFFEKQDLKIKQNVSFFWIGKDLF